MHTKQTQSKARVVAEDIRQMPAIEVAALVQALCEDNMGNKLEIALAYENLDRQFNSGV